VAGARAPREHREPLLMATTLVTATLRVALPVRLTGHDRKGGGGKRPAFEGRRWRRGQGGSGDQSTWARRRSSRYTGGVSVATGARGRQEGENQHEWGRGRRGRSRRPLRLRHAGGKHVIGVAQAVVGPEGGRAARPRKLHQCSTVPPGPLVRAGRGGGAGRRPAAGPKHTRCLRGRPRWTRTPGDASQAAMRGDPRALHAPPPNPQWSLGGPK